MSLNPTHCFIELAGHNIPDLASPESDRCEIRHATLSLAQRACSMLPLCDGVSKDAGIGCGGVRMTYELRSARVVEPHSRTTSWLLLRNASEQCATMQLHPRRYIGEVLAASRAQLRRELKQAKESEANASIGEILDVREPWGSTDRLGAMLEARERLAAQRISRGTPAFERFPSLAFRYRDWGRQTRHGRGDAYPLYTLDTLRNLADHLFDSSTGYKGAPERARRVGACELVYSTFRPTSAFLRRVHEHIPSAYLLLTDTADEPITRTQLTETLLHSDKLRHWWAVDNEVLNSPKLDSIPLGVPDALELGVKGEPSSVSFHANTSEYIKTLRAAHAQPKHKWVMMQVALLTLTHPEA